MYSTRNILDMLNGGYEAKSYTVVDSDDFVIVTTADPNEAFGVADEDAGDRVYEETKTMTIVDGVLFTDVDLIELSSGPRITEWTAGALAGPYFPADGDWLDQLMRDGPFIK